MSHHLYHSCMLEVYYVLDSRYVVYLVFEWRAHKLSPIRGYLTSKTATGNLTLHHTAHCYLCFSISWGRFHIHLPSTQSYSQWNTESKSLFLFAFMNLHWNTLNVWSSELPHHGRVDISNIRFFSMDQSVGSLCWLWHSYAIAYHWRRCADSYGAFRLGARIWFQNCA